MRRTFAEINQMLDCAALTPSRSDFAYDGLMRRRLRTEMTWNGSGWSTNQIVRYVYDGPLVIQERDGNNIALLTYTRGRDLSGGLSSAGGIGGLLARTDMGLFSAGLASAHAYYQADGNGNITCLINTNQSNIAKYLYDPFGGLLEKSGPLADANHITFSSKEFHAPSGLYYYGLRFCDPLSQRWLNRDPIGEAGGLNLYGYVGNNPIMFIDPYGLSFWGDFGNGLNNTVSGIGQSMGQGLYDLSHLTWSQNEYNRIGNLMYSLDTPENPAATPYVVGALGVSAAAATTAAALGSLESAGVIDTAPQGNNVIRVICKPLRRGVRLDKPHHGKWYHWQWWKW